MKSDKCERAKQQKKCDFFFRLLFTGAVGFVFHKNIQHCIITNIARQKTNKTHTEKTIIVLAYM